MQPVKARSEEDPTSKR